jgi:hypothetical protein
MPSIAFNKYPFTDWDQLIFPLHDLSGTFATDDHSIQAAPFLAFEMVPSFSVSIIKFPMRYDLFVNKGCYNHICWHMKEQINIHSGSYI